jgi:hypothetical protein
MPVLGSQCNVRVERACIDAHHLGLHELAWDLVYPELRYLHPDMLCVCTYNLIIHCLKCLGPFVAVSL